MTEKKTKTIIGVVADTHMPDAGSLPLRLLSELEKVDVIFHLGDFCDLETYKEFQKIAPLIAVYGNMDGPDIRALVPEKKTIEINGFNLGLVHGWGPPKCLETRVLKSFKDVNVILFGHSHIPLFAKIDGIYLFNPGSPTLNTDCTGTFGILELGDTLSHQIIHLE